MHACFMYVHMYTLYTAFSSFSFNKIGGILQQLSSKFLANNFLLRTSTFLLFDLYVDDESYKLFYVRK